MPRPRRSRPQRPAKNDDEADFIHDDDDDEEDDYEFVPGVQADDDDDDDEFDNEDDDDNDDMMVGFLEGHISVEADGKLHYQGGTFHLQTLCPVKDFPWNPLSSNDSNTVQPSSLPVATFAMVGTMTAPPMGGKEEDDQDGKPRKLPQRTFDLTWTILPGTNGGAAVGKSTGESEEDDDGKPAAKQPAKQSSSSSSVLYNVVGRETTPNPNGSHLVLEFQGGFHPTSSNKTALTCQCKYVMGEAPAKASPAAAAAAKPAAAAAYNNNDDDDDDDADADEEFGMDELIALHQDANMSVDQVQQETYSRRRTRNSGTNDDDDDEEKEPKKIKAAAKDDDDDDDDDVGF